MRVLLAVVCAWVMFCAVYAVVPGRVDLRVRFSSGP